VLLLLLLLDHECLGLQHKTCRAAASALPAGTLSDTSQATKPCLGNPRRGALIDTEKPQHTSCLHPSQQRLQPPHGTAPPAPTCRCTAACHFSSVSALRCTTPCSCIFWRAFGTPRCTCLLRCCSASCLGRLGGPNLGRARCSIAGITRCGNRDSTRRQQEQGLSGNCSALAACVCGELRVGC
jgi:hypothetical protein